MDRLQKGIMMAKAEGFNQILKAISKNNFDYTVLGMVEDIINNTLKCIDYIKVRHGNKNKP